MIEHRVLQLILYSLPDDALWQQRWHKSSMHCGNLYTCWTYNHQQCWASSPWICTVIVFFRKGNQKNWRCHTTRFPKLVELTAVCNTLSLFVVIAHRLQDTLATKLQQSKQPTTTEDWLATIQWGLFGKTQKIYLAEQMYVHISVASLNWKFYLLHLFWDRKDSEVENKLT